jgi:hypothetical protein
MTIGPPQVLVGEVAAGPDGLRPQERRVGLGMTVGSDVIEDPSPDEAVPLTELGRFTVYIDPSTLDLATPDGTPPRREG